MFKFVDGPDINHSQNLFICLLTREAAQQKFLLKWNKERLIIQTQSILWSYMTHWDSVLQKTQFSQSRKIKIRKGRRCAFTVEKVDTQLIYAIRNTGFLLDTNSRNSMNNIEIVQENAEDFTLHNSGESNDFRLTQQQYQALMSLIQKYRANDNVDSTPAYINQVGSITTFALVIIWMVSDGKILSVNNFSKNKEC